MDLQFEQQPRTIIFDFDGVVLDSARLKTMAFAQCYEGEDRAKIAEVIRYQEQHGGIGRQQKFEYFEEHVFGREAEQKRIAELCERFGNIIDNAMMEAPFIPGARELLEDLLDHIPLHVVSGMPDHDLKLVLARRGLQRFFVSAAGSPKKKLSEFQRILQSERCAPSEALAVGDSRTEFDAAVTLGIPFLAVVADNAPDFFPASTPRCRDLTTFRTLMPLSW